MEKKRNFRGEEDKGNSVSSSCSPVLKSYVRVKKQENWIKKSSDLSKIPKILMINPGVNQPGMKSDRELVDEAMKKYQYSNKSNYFLSKSPYNATPEKLPKVKKRRISEFHQKFEEKWLGCQQLTGSEHFSALIGLLDSIIQEDFLFGSYLLRIKNSILYWKKNTESEIMKKRLNLESILPKQGVSSRVQIHKKQKIIKSEDIKQEKHNTASQITLNIKPESDIAVSASKLVSQLIIPSSSEQILSDKLETIVQECETLKSKINKYEQLINALKNRGYPLDAIYINDVLNQTPALPVQSSLISSPLLDQTVLSSDDSID